MAIKVEEEPLFTKKSGLSDTILSYFDREEARIEIPQQEKQNRLLSIVGACSAVRVSISIFLLRVLSI